MHDPTSFYVIYKKIILKRQGKEKTEALLVVDMAVANPAAQVPAAAAVADMSLLELREPLQLSNLEPLLVPPTRGEDG